MMMREHQQQRGASDNSILQVASSTTRTSTTRTSILPPTAAFSAGSFPMTSSNNDITVPCKVRRALPPCGDKYDDDIISFDGQEAIPMMCTISHWIPPPANCSNDGDTSKEPDTPELLLQQPSPPLQNTRIPLSARQGHENMSSSHGSYCSRQTATTVSSSSSSTLQLPPREISISSLVLPCMSVGPEPAPASDRSYRIPLHDIVLVDTTLAGSPGSPGSAARKLVLTLPTCALELDCISRNAYDLILACLEAKMEKSKIRKVKKQKKRFASPLSRENTLRRAADATTTTMTTSNCRTFTSPASLAMAGAAAETAATTTIDADCSVDALTDHLMFLAAESESLADKLGRRIGKAMVDISECCVTWSPHRQDSIEAATADSQVAMTTRTADT